ncbi:RTA1 like protein [Aspergillus sclerotiicarbonarius CBS 121057]|uniref:RTA1 like protein n=1 Tax=Aspergillus sclerotiicarbonarius (strain CBS 121057 / IBT 28362) TaxID=1448318 RepID=A0A319E351_ASPSB|nr:RTA1 like protein [Aspergillus sclerotiicarbonarius CBS 121057]
MDHNLYEYNPSQGAAIVFAVAFSLTAAAHTYLMVWNRTWHFLPLLIGLFLEITGYITRAISTQSPEALTPFIIQSLCILVAPALLAASIYTILGRTIAILHGESLSLIRPSWLTKIFVTGDILSFVIQCMGAGMLSSTSDLDLGKIIIIIGLALQIVFSGCFIVITVVFHMRINRCPTVMATSLDGYGKLGRWRRLLFIVCVVSIMVFIRSVFRLVEYAGGEDGFLLAHEVFLYIFDSLLMLAVAGVLVIYHPSRLMLARNDVGDLDMRRC